ncbi:MAG: phage protease [Verrucomicrobiota bacterium]
MKSHVVIFNRAPLASCSGWIHIVPKGELPNAEAGIVQVLDDAAMDSILAGIEKDKNRLGDRWPGIYAGREHFIYDDTKDSAALAWFKDFEKRADGIWAKDDGLTPAGSAAVTNREYKFTSFVSDPKQLKKLDGKRYRITGIETIGFTNQANGKELLTPITNRDPNFAVSREPVDSTANQNIKNKKMKTVCTLLGLSAEADEQSVHAAVAKLQNRVTELTPLADENTKLKNRLTALDSEAVDTLLAAHGVKEEKVLNRLKPVIAALPTLAERETALVDFGFKKIEAKPAPAARVLNRGNAAGTGAEAAPLDEQAKVEKIRNRCSELTKSGVKFDTAWAQAVAEANK